MKSILALFPVAAALLLASCGVSTDYVEASAPSAPYQAVVVKGFDLKMEAPDAKGSELAKEFASVLSEEIENVKRFPKVTTGSYTGRAVRIEGDVTYLEEGNNALRIGVGFGAGAAHFSCTARFIDNQSGKLLGTMQVERSSKSGLRGVADTFAIVRRSAAGDIAAKASDFAASAH
jgi:hypothetical protein